MLASIAGVGLNFAAAQDEPCVDDYEPNDQLEEAASVRIGFRGHDGAMSINAGLCSEGDVDYLRFFTEKSPPWRGKMRLEASSVVTGMISTNGGTDWDPLPRDVSGDEFHVHVVQAVSALTTPVAYTLKLDALLLSPTPTSTASMVLTPTAEATPLPPNPTATFTQTPPPAYIPSLLRGR